MRIEPKRRFCVYTHSVEGKVFYVGAGVPSRPYTDIDRNPTWARIVQEHGYFDVDIVNWFASKASAFRFEKTEITRLRPEANRGFHKPPARAPYTSGPLSIGFNQRALRQLTRIQQTFKQQAMSTKVSDVMKLAIQCLWEKECEHDKPLASQKRL